MRLDLASWLLILPIALTSPQSLATDEEPPPRARFEAAAVPGALEVDAEATTPPPRSRFAQQVVADVDAPRAPAGPITLERYVYACTGNSYNTDPAVNILCEQSFQYCPPGPDAPRQFYRYTTTITGIEAIPGPGPAWTLNGVLCLPTATTDPAAPDAPPLPVVTLADFQSLPLPAAQPTIQPTGGHALIRARTNVYVNPDSTLEQTYDITLLNTPVTVRATPTTYTWDFGDGTDPLTTTDPGAPYPDLTTWHEYTQPGPVTITLTTTYTGAYSIAGGPYLDITGTTDITSDPIPLQLISTTNRLTG